jgi:Transposase DDE domain
VPTPRNTERDRYAPLPGDPPEVAAWRERMNTDDAKAIYKERASTVECANAQARNLTRFLVRGLEAVTALWHALAQNMFCTWRLVAA